LLKSPKIKAKPVRAAISIGKKIEKRAVFRNKLKRKFNEALKEIITKTMPGTDILIIAKKKALEKKQTS